MSHRCPPNRVERNASMKMLRMMAIADQLRFGFALLLITVIGLGGLRDRIGRLAGAIPGFGFGLLKRECPILT